MRLKQFLQEISDSDDPYAAGMRAYHKGGANPFKKGVSNQETKKWQEWELGYQDAGVDRRGGYGKGLEESYNKVDKEHGGWYIVNHETDVVVSGPHESKAAARSAARKQWHNSTEVGIEYGIKDNDDEFHSMREPMQESESNYIAMSSYQAKSSQVEDEIEKLKLNMRTHRKAYLATDRTNWGYVGDMERLLKQLTEINDWLGSSNTH